MFNKFLKDESGATAIEYTLIAALVGVALVGALEALEEDLTGALEGVGDALDSAAGAGGGGAAAP